MAKWNIRKLFGRGDKEAAGTSPAPSQPPSPQQPPAAPAGDGGDGKKPGRLRRMFSRKPKEAAAPPEAPPATPAAPPAQGPAEAGDGGGDGGGAAGGGEGGGGGDGEDGDEGDEEEEERQYPNSISVTADGDWRISSTEWEGLMSGNISGHKAKMFIDAYEAGNWEDCVQMVADAWDENVGAQIVPSQSTVKNMYWN